MTQPLYLTAKEAAAELNISLPTLYAYVSRNLIRSERTGKGRTRLYRADDVRALIERRHGLQDSAADPSSRDAPLLESALTLIRNGRYYYRGRDALLLAESASLESIATLLWNCHGNDPFTDLPASSPVTDLSNLDNLTPVARCQALLPRFAALDLQAFSITNESRLHVGARILRLISSLVAGCDDLNKPCHRLLAAGWGIRDQESVELLRMALVLFADHELNPSTFTVRCVASTGANLYLAVNAGFSALQGPLHGGQVEQASALIEECGRADNPRHAVAARLRRGEGFGGFGHPLYPEGDPRAKLLLSQVKKAFPDHPQLVLALETAAAVEEFSGEKPNGDFALATLAAVIGLGPDHALGLFAVGRAAGWIGHALEQYVQARLIRPRARYTGPPPRGSDHSGPESMPGST